MEAMVTWRNGCGGLDLYWVSINDDDDDEYYY